MEIKFPQHKGNRPLGSAAPVSRPRTSIRVGLLAPIARRIRFNISGIYPLPPLGLATIAAALRAAGHAVWILDAPAARLQGVKLARALAHLPEPDLLGIGATLFSAPGASEAARMGRQIFPRAQIVLGGPITVAEPRHLARRFPEVDHFAFGPAERSMVRLAEAIARGDPPRGIPGILSRGRGALVRPPVDRLDLDDSPFPALDLLPMARYRMHPPFGERRPVALLETTRGCEAHCAFCSLPAQIEAKSPERVEEELRWLVKAHNVKEVHVVDPTFAWNRERAIEIAAVFARVGRGKLTWSCKTRSDSVDPALLRAMAKAGCRTVSFGLESGDEEVLQRLGKGCDLGASWRAIRWTKEAGMRTVAYFMVGCPGDTEESVRRTRHLARRSGADFVLFGELLPDPHSRLARAAVAEGRFSEEAIHSFYLDEEDGPFRHTAFGGQPRDQVRRWVRGSYLRTYGDPRYLLRQLGRSRNLADLWNLASGGWHLVADALRPHRY